MRVRELGGVERCRESGPKPGERFLEDGDVAGIRNLGGVSWRSPGPAGSWSAGRQEHPILAGGAIEIHSGERILAHGCGIWSRIEVARIRGTVWGSAESDYRSR
jgi:hypothetical protein